MAASNTHVADLLDTVHHEMYSMVHSHNVYKCKYYITQKGSVIHCLAYIILLGEGGKEEA